MANGSNSGPAEGQKSGRNPIVGGEPHVVRPSALRTEFDDCEVSLGPGTTTLRAELMDHSALLGLMQWIAGLGLELIDVRGAAPPPAE